MVVIVIPAIAGLDVGRFYWSNIDVSLALIGFFFSFVSTILLNWAMIVNPYFEPTVRIQKDRDQKVITSGQYNIVRHHGYLAAILFTLSIPLLNGSAFLFSNYNLRFLMIIRTLLEDKTLQKELNGCSEYVKQTRYRILPRVW